MPCSTIKYAEQQARERAEQLKQLGIRLVNGQASFVKTGNKISIEGWKERGSWCDSCAVNALKQHADFRVRRIVAAAVSVTNKIGQAVSFGHEHTHGGVPHTH